jgi:protein prenyltransferase alpha subunit repeat containing protein 1
MSAPPTAEKAFPTGGALLRQLDALFAKDPFIDELGLVQSVDIFTNSPQGQALELEAADANAAAQQLQQGFILTEHKLGIAFWAIPLLFHASNDLFGELYSLFKANEATSEQVQLLIGALRCLLLINADHYTAWNARKQLLLSNQLQYAEEMRFLDLLFSKHPKSGESWAHRRWVLQVLWKQTPPAHAGYYVDPLFKNELQQCSKAAERYPKNYYAWTHRKWLMSRCVDDVSALKSELKTAEDWNNAHVSDHCGFQFRQVLLTALPQEETEVWQHELLYLSTLMEDYPAHEAMWMHRRFLFRRLLEATRTTLQQTHLVTAELRVAKQQLNDIDLANYQRNRKFALRYQLWICTMGLRSVTRIPNQPLFTTLTIQKTATLKRLTIEQSEVNWLKLQGLGK